MKTAVLLFTPVLLASPLRAQCELQKLLAPDPVSDAHFGESVAVSGDFALVGAPGHPQTGKVYVYHRTGTSWTLYDQLTPSDGDGGEYYGGAVDIEATRAVVGAMNEEDGGFPDGGAAYVYELQGTSWVETAKLTGSDPSGFARFGSAVSVAGDRIAVGARQDEGVTFNSGAAYVFELAGQTWVEAAELVHPLGLGGTWFGTSVAVSGDVVVVGTLFDPGNGPEDQGAAYVFERQGTVWTYTARLATNDPPEDTRDILGDEFGGYVAVEGTTILVGAAQDDGAGFSAGAGYVFEKVGSQWLETRRLLAAGAFNVSQNVSRVAIEGDRVVVGGPGNFGRGYLYERVGGIWAEVAKLEAPDGQSEDFLGNAVALSGDTLLLGAYFDDDGGTNAGAAYVFAASGCVPGTPYCLGVGCPCGNDAPGTGCRNSSGVGALLLGTGTRSVAADDLVLVANGAPPNNSGLVFAGDAQLAPPVFVGDGLGCAGGLAFRYRPSVVSNLGEYVMQHLVANAPPGFITPGVTRNFQLWTRDVLCGPPPAPCPSPCGHGNNLSSAYSVTFEP